MKRLYGCHPDPRDKRDIPLMLPPLDLSKIPPAFDMLTGSPAAYDQMSVGSCVGNACSAVVAITFMETIANFGTPSRLFNYFNARLLRGTQAWDAGATIRDGMKALNKYGHVPEPSWPYNVRAYNERPPKLIYDDAAHRKLTAYARVPQDLMRLKQCLALHNPIAFGFTVYESFESEQVARTGIVPAPNIHAEKPLGGHAVVLVGYDDAHGAFLVRNSWGTKWGIKGHFWMEYGVVTDPDFASDFWTIPFTMLKELTEWPGYYAGSDGHIYSFKVRERVDLTRPGKRLKAALDGLGLYRFVSLRKNHKSHLKLVHRLVCEAFNGPPPSGTETSHLDGDRTNNSPKNLIWETRRENHARKKEHGTHDGGCRNSRAKFSREDIAEIRRLLSEGVTARKVGTIFNCNGRTIGKIKRGEHYKCE